MNAKFETITPERARVDLEKAQGKNFRKLHPQKVKPLARAMRDRKWEPNGESVKYDTSGILKDGQHRYQACIEANVPFNTLVVYGIESDLNIDNGSKRQLSDWLEHRGEINTTTLAAALRLQWRYENGKLWSFTNVGDQMPTNNELLDVLDRNSDIREAVKLSMKYKMSGAGSSLAFVLYNAMKTNRDLALSFIDELASQANLSENHPLLLLNQKLLKTKGQKVRIRDKYKLIWLIKAWNAYALGRSVTVAYYRFREVGPAAEKYPDFVQSHDIEMGVEPESVVCEADDTYGYRTCTG